MTNPPPAVTRRAITTRRFGMAGESIPAIAAGSTRVTNGKIFLETGRLFPDDFGILDPAT
jgi:hypothetical protein